MNGHHRARHLFAGMTLSHATHLGLVARDQVRRGARGRHEQPCRASVSQSQPCAAVHFMQPKHHNWAKYKQVTRALHGKINMAAALVTVIIVIMLGWRAAAGEHISPERWFCGVGSGWFIAWMGRLGLFAALAAPRHISFQNGMIRLSGLGILKPDQILRWSLHHGVMLNTHEGPCAHLEILCRWFGWERRWMMSLHDNAEAERLRQHLDFLLPHASRPQQAR